MHQQEIADVAAAHNRDNEVGAIVRQRREGPPVGSVGAVEDDPVVSLCAAEAVEGERPTPAGLGPRIKEARALAIRNFQLQTLGLAADALDRTPREARSISTLTLSLSRRGYLALEEERR